MIGRVVLVLLLAGVVATSLEIVLERHEARKLFSVMQELTLEKNELDREWGQLLLEEGTWATHGRVEDIAREKLDMTLPDLKTIYRIRS